MGTSDSFDMGTWEMFGEHLPNEGWIGSLDGRSNKICAGFSQELMSFGGTCSMTV